MTARPTVAPRFTRASAVGTLVLPVVVVTLLLAVLGLLIGPHALATTASAAPANLAQTVAGHADGHPTTCVTGAGSAVLSSAPCRGGAPGVGARPDTDLVALALLLTVLLLTTVAHSPSGSRPEDPRRVGTGRSRLLTRGLIRV